MNKEAIRPDMQDDLVEKDQVEIEEETELKKKVSILVEWAKEKNPNFGSHQHRMGSVEATKVNSGEIIIPEGIYTFPSDNDKSKLVVATNVWSGKIDGNYLNIRATGECVITNEKDNRFPFKISDIDMSNPEESIRKIVSANSSENE